MNIHDNSILSNRETERYRRRQVIIEIYRKANKPLTDREVRDLGGFREMNEVRPRITEMVNEGILLEFSQIFDKASRRTVRTVHLAPYLNLKTDPKTDIEQGQETFI